MTRSFATRLSKSGASVTKPNFMLEHPVSQTPMVHLFDEPQFNTQDGYIGFMLDFFKKLKKEGRLVFLCLHPNERYHIDILKESCERFLFVQKGVEPKRRTSRASWRMSGSRVTSAPWQIDWKISGVRPHLMPRSRPARICRCPTRSPGGCMA